MRMVKLSAMLLAVVLAGPMNLVAQDENSDKQQNTNEKQREKKSEEVRELRQDSKDESLSKPLGAYHLEFVITELDEGKKVNSRTYSLLAQQGILNKLRAGVRVPITTGTGSNSLPTQFQYIDVGVSIDCTVQERGGTVLMSSTIDVSSMTQQHEEQTHQPVIRQMKSEMRTILSPGKPTVISYMDDPTGKGRFQLEVTATKIK